MEHIINQENIDEILNQTVIHKDDFLFLIKSLYYYCIEMDINEEKIDYKILEDNFSSLYQMEQISIYVFSQYNNSLKDFDRVLKTKAMELAAIAFEKLGNFIENIETQEIGNEGQNLKQLRYYFRASVAYLLSGNSPSSIYISKKIGKSIKQLRELNIEINDLYELSYQILSRNFSVRNIQKVEYVKILSNLILYIRTGNEEFYRYTLNIIDLFLKNFLENYESYEYWMLTYIKLCIFKFFETNVWVNLKGKYSDQYIYQLVKSKPSVMELWPNQIEFVNDENGFINNNEIKRAIINYPTSGGKSLIAELAIVKELERDISKKCIYIVPTNALVYEVTKRLKSRFRRLKYNVNNVLGGYEPSLSSDDLIDYNVIITTPEKLDMIIRNNNNDILNGISLIVFDEFHKIQDKERGWIIEGNISYLINHELYTEIKLIILSAIMDNDDQIISWIDNGKLISKRYRSNWQPTLKVKGMAQIDYGDWLKLDRNDPQYKSEYRNFIAEANIKYFSDKDYINPVKTIKLFNIVRYHYLNNKGLDKEINIDKNRFIAKIANKLRNTGGSLIYFNTKQACENFINSFEIAEEYEIRDEIRKLIYYLEKRVGNDHLLISGLRKGIIYHHGSIPLDIREALEDYFANGYIKIMVCTTTLAEGVNFPIQNFIYTGINYKAEKTLSFADFKNIAGRAGRAYQSTFGQVILIDFYNQTDKQYLDFNNYKNEVSSSLILDSELFSIIDQIEYEDTEKVNRILDEVTHNNFIKTLILFYNTISIDRKDITDFLKRTLFSLQMESTRKEKIFYLANKTFDYLDLKSDEDRAKVQKSGLSFASYYRLNNLANIIEENLGYLDWDCKIEQILTEELFTELLCIKECKPDKIRRSTPTSGIIEINHYSLFIDWIESDMDIQHLSDKYFQKVDAKFRSARITDYIKEMYEFKLPWIVGILVGILKERVRIDMFNLKPALQINTLIYLPLYIKYGLNSVAQIDLTKLGFNSRDSIKEIARFINERFQYINIEKLKEILKGIDPTTLKDETNLSDYEIRVFTRISNNLQDITNEISDKGFIITHIASTRYNLCMFENKSELLQHIIAKYGNIKLVHERTNFYDENAVEIYFEEYKIGYIPRKINEEIAYYLDLYIPYRIEVVSIDIVNINTYIEIILKIYFEN